jgi:hypothetical protein
MQLKTMVGLVVYRTYGIGLRADARSVAGFCVAVCFELRS